MNSARFELPAMLAKLIESGVWPTTNPNSQELRPLLGKDAAQKLSREDDRIVRMTPPFHTIGDEVRCGNALWKNGVTTPEEINYDKALIFADFGLGSDSPIILYYELPDSPNVMYLR